MATAQTQSQKPAGETLDDDSAITILRHLEEERGKMFTEAEFRDMRGAVLDELAHGARIRPFTLFTFAILALGLLTLLVIGVIHASGKAAGDYALAAVSALALTAAVYFFWSCLRGIKLDTLRSLEARLAELEQLREHHLVSQDEYHQLQAHILIARQPVTGKETRPQSERSATSR